MNYVILSQQVPPKSYSDELGVVYNYPKRYWRRLAEGDRFIYHQPSSRNVAGNPDSPQAVVFLTSIVDVTVGSWSVLHTLPCRLRLEYVCLA